MNLKTLIDYYNKCPICDGSMVIDTDLSIPSTVDKEKYGLVVSVYENRIEPTKFYLLYSNKIQCDYPFIFNTPENILRRQIHSVPSDAYDRLQLEISCIDCGRFRYWSNNIIFDHVEKNMSPINIRWERAEFKTDKENMILSNDLKRKELTVHFPKNKKSVTIPFVGFFKGLPLKDADTIMLQVKKQLLVS